MRAVGACRPGVFELDDDNAGYALDQPNARLVEFLDAGDFVDPLFRPAAERLDIRKRAPSAAPPDGAERASSHATWSIGCQAR
ncbi:hypothetical protein [Mycolicibacterium agri]|uniref:Uncharacterized protein n=1 Tax=Mycolicibacterium agri TaxID=36811 RepID=A0A7I9VUU9_MYCAG|nr:hypothetical protein [Mycolicibacterium agri]GFG49195.1 hypothetical protein MAGR_06360 [Mycolicibacterium agri]